jgi:hypothetical protein
MKFEHVKTWKMASKVAAVAALGAFASAQTAKSMQGEQFGRPAIVLPQVSMENDIHTPWDARGKIVLERPDQRQLELVFKLRPRVGSDLRAFMPAFEDMEQSLELRNGTPGGMAVIHLEVRRGGGTKVVGFFDEDGTFQAELPAGFQAHDVIARGEEALVRNAHGGLKVPASKRPAADDMSVEEAGATAFLNWARWYAETYTNLQFRTGGRMRSAKLDDPDMSGSIAVSSSGEVSRGVGHAQRGKVVENDTEGGADPREVNIDPVDPVRGTGALGKIHLQRPAASSARTPAIGGGHTQPGSGVDDDTQSGAPQAAADPADPVGGKRAFGKIKLERPAVPTQRNDHALTRKL